MNMENPKLSMDSFGKEIAEAQFKTARKNDIWKNNEGEQITNVEFGKKKRKLTKKEKDYLFKYHLEVYSVLSPFLNKNEKQWLVKSI